MVLPESIMAALVTMFLRNILGRLPFMQASIAHTSPSNFSMNPPLIIVGSLLCYLNKGRCLEWIQRVRNRRASRSSSSSHRKEEPHLVSERRIEKAKSWLNNSFQGSKKLQENAKQFVASEPEDVDFCQKINTTQNASRFVPKSGRRRNRRRRNRQLHKTAESGVQSKEEDEESNLSASETFTASSDSSSQSAQCSKPIGADLEKADTRTRSWRFSTDLTPLAAGNPSPRKSPGAKENLLPHRATVNSSCGQSPSHAESRRVPSENVDLRAGRSRLPTIVKPLRLDSSSSRVSATQTKNIGDSFCSPGCSGDQNALEDMCSLCRRRKHQEKENSLTLTGQVKFDQLDKTVGAGGQENRGVKCDASCKTEQRSEATVVRKRGRFRLNFGSAEPSKSHKPDRGCTMVRHTRSGKAYGIY